MKVPARGDLHRAARRQSTPVLAFDLGGTWFRSALLLPEGRVARVRRRPAVTCRGAGETTADPQAGLIEAVVAETRRRRREHEFDTVGISLGAAMDHRTGRVIASAPLWGDRRVSFDPAALLRRAEPDLGWTVLNDVTALAFAALADLPAEPEGKITAVTISSGIAARTLDPRSGRIPVDPVHGLQGEIGHLPARLRPPGGGRTELRLPCDCGAVGHVSSYSSGPGIERLLAELHMAEATRQETWRSLRRGVEEGQEGALAFLDSVTAPVAEVMLHFLTIDPDIRHTILTGGVVAALGDHYLQSLFRNMRDAGPYGFGDEFHDFYHGHFSLNIEDEHLALRGAGLYAQYLKMSHDTVM